MNPEVKAKWIAALRSGKYRQVKETLKKRNGGMCCLGVLCDVYAKENPQNKEAKWEYGSTSKAYSFLNSEGDLPVSVYEWAGLENHDPNTGVQKFTDDHDRNYTHTFSSLNDNAGYTFEQIAQIIEEKF
jgi:hypothetical protein